MKTNEETLGNTNLKGKMKETAVEEHCKRVREIVKEQVSQITRLETVLFKIKLSTRSNATEEANKES